jgi:hypothetical protein
MAKIITTSQGQRHVSYLEQVRESSEWYYTAPLFFNYYFTALLQVQKNNIWLYQ